MRSIFSIADQVERAIPCRQCPAERRGEPAIGDFGTGDRGSLAFRLQHEVQRHRQPRRRSVVAGRLVHPRQAVDQADLAAACFRGVSAVHAVDDAGQHEPRLCRIKQRAVEQLEIKALADADRLLWQARAVPRDVAIELAIDRLPDRRHRRQGEQLAVGERNIRRPLRQQHAIEAEFSAIEFAQRRGIGDGGAALQRRILCRTRRQSAHSIANTMARNRGARLMPQLTPRNETYSRKKAPHIAVKRLPVRISSRQRATIRPLLVTTTQRPSCLRMASTRPRPGMGSPA